MARKPAAAPTTRDAGAKDGRDATARNVLPVPDVASPALTTVDARDRSWPAWSRWAAHRSVEASWACSRMPGVDKECA